MSTETNQIFWQSDRSIVYVKRFGFCYLFVQITHDSNFKHKIYKMLSLQSDSFIRDLQR